MTLHKNLKYKNGFTLVELLVVIAVIGILVGITIVSYGNWRRQSATTSLKNDLSNAATAMENYRTFNNGYPTIGSPTTLTALPMSLSTVLTTYTQTPGDTITLTSTDGTNYCIDALNSGSFPSMPYYIDTITNTPTAGSCAARTNVPIPGVPTSLATSGITSSSITFSWTPSTNAVNYTLKCSTDSAFINNVQTSTISASPATLTSLNANSGYYCEINATDGAGTSAWSSYITASTLIASPSGLVATGASTTQINYSWTASSGASSYTIQLATNSAFTTGVQTKSQTGTSGSFTGLTPSTQYYFQVQSVNSFGTVGAYSGTVLGATYTNWGVYSILTGVGDWNGDGNNDIIAYNPTSGVFDLHLGLGTGQFGPAITLYTPGTTVVNIIGPGILPGQTSPIVMWTQSSSGTPGYYLQSNGSTGVSGSPVAAGTNYASYTSIFAAPKFYTGKAPFYIGQTGSLYEEQLAASGTSTTLLNYGSGWSSSYPGNNTFGVGDFNGDGIGDIAGIASSGAMTIYPGTGTGTTGTTFSGGSGWLNNYVTGGWDYNGDGHPDILRLSTAGVLTLYEGSDTSGGTLAWYLNGGVPYTVN
jgi:prepilin-type N-terminal cleavage/methylation domain-containing protein